MGKMYEAWNNRNVVYYIGTLTKKKNIISNETSANFFLLNFDFCKLSANYVLKKLEKKGIILRSMESYKMKNKLRVTIGSSKENNKFIKNLDHIL